MQSKAKRSEPGGHKAQASDLWSRILKAGVHAQRLIPEAICVGGTASALYAAHRISLDTDHVLSGLREHFDQVRATLEADPEWKTARVQPPVLILGSFGGIQVGFRQLKRRVPVETSRIQTREGALVVPTLDELICMKAFLAYSRNATRDFIDLAALSGCSTEPKVVESLLKLDSRYGDTQTVSVGLEVAKALSACAPYDLNEAELANYKGLKPKWHAWAETRRIAQRLGEQLAASLILKET